MKKYNIVVVGASGNVGRKILDILEERKFPINNLAALASKKTAGKVLSYTNDKSLIIENLEDFDFSQTDIVLSSAGGKVAGEFVYRAQAKGAIIIDNSSYFRMHEDVPLVVPEVNSKALSNVKKGTIIANPNCSTIQMVVALKPLHDAFKIKRVIVSTYQSVSGAGKKAIDELKTQIIDHSDILPQVFTKQIGMNIIPHIDVFMEDGSTKEEWKMVEETKKILDPEIKVHANCARVPSLNSHAEYINIETHNNIDEAKAYNILKNAPGIKIWDKRENGAYATPLEVSGTDDIFISRIRKDYSVENGISFWCVADNLRKGAALNAVQIAELLI